MSLGKLTAFLSRRSSVADDWLFRLPEGKARVFASAQVQWGAAYGMLSVALDDAFALRASGKLVRARMQAANCDDLLDRLTVPMVTALAALESHARHFGTLPAIEPLNPSYFRGEFAQSVASRNRLLHLVLLSDRSRFFYKLRSLTSIVEQLAKEFHSAAAEIVEATSTQPGACWASLECLHYDLNTCLRETEVVFKSFLCALPSTELETLQVELEAPAPVLLRRLRLGVSRASS